MTELFDPTPGDHARSARDDGARPPRRAGEKAASAALVLSVAGLAALTLLPFVIPLVWAVLLAYITWPAFARLHRAVRNPDVAALMMLCLVAAITALVASGLWALFSSRISGTFDELQINTLSREGDALIDGLRALPWVGNPLADAVRNALSDPGRLLAVAGGWLRDWLSGEIVAFAGNVGAFVVKLGIMLLALFFLYREGHGWWRDVRGALERLLRDRAPAYIDNVPATVDAVLYGVIGGAGIQGVAAGLGYWLFGAPAPVVLAVVTAVVSILPYGTALAIVPVSLWLALTGAPWAALGLAAWGAVVVGLADNVVRPLLISRVSRVHLLLTTLGVIGGIAAFGLIGVFVGPVVLAIVLTWWRGWLQPAAPQTAANASEPVPALLAAAPAAVPGRSDCAASDAVHRREVHR